MMIDPRVSYKEKILYLFSEGHSILGRNFIWFQVYLSHLEKTKNRPTIAHIFLNETRNDSVSIKICTVITRRAAM